MSGPSGQKRAPSSFQRRSEAKSGGRGGATCHPLFRLMNTARRRVGGTV